MSKLPKLRLKMPDGHEETHRFDKAKPILSEWGVLFVVEGQVINCYEELIKLAGQNSYENKESLEVTVIPFIEGG